MSRGNGMFGRAGTDPLTPFRENASRLADRWWVFLLLGIAATIVGVILVIDVFTAVRTLALLVGLSLLLTGLLDLLGFDRFTSRWLGVLAGIISIVAGVLAIVWPGVTLWAVAVVAGVGLIATGVLRAIGAITSRGRDGWGWVLVGGVVSVIAGVLALAWPAATILVLAILLGVRTLFLGLGEIWFALRLRRLRGRLDPSR